MKCNYLTGENIKPLTNKQAKLMIGKNVTYLQNRDIDRNRQAHFPQHGTICAVHGRCIAINDSDDFRIHMADLVEMVDDKQ